MELYSILLVSMIFTVVPCHTNVKLPHTWQNGSGASEDAYLEKSMVIDGPPNNSIVDNAPKQGHTKRSKKLKRLLDTRQNMRSGRRLVKNEVANHRIIESTTRKDEMTSPGSAFYVYEDQDDIGQEVENNELELNALVKAERGLHNGKRRVKRQFWILTSYRVRYTPEWFFLANTPVAPKASYGNCLVYAYENNDYCLPGEVCVDKKTFEKFTGSCSGITNVPNCDDCTPPAAGNAGPNPNPSPTPCPPGCKPGKDCPLPPWDGVCVDSTLPTNDYYLPSTTQKPDTPMAFYAGRLHHGDPCVAYGDAIDTYNRGKDDFDEKLKKLQTDSGATAQFGSQICNWKEARLECIPEKPRGTTTTTMANAGSNSPNANPAEIDAYLRPKGKCQCMLALGEKAVVLQNEDNKKICYIPAHKGHHSDCDHDIFLPYGEINGITKTGFPLKRTILEPASKLCVPHAECRAGYKYVGLRCQCEKKAKWNPKDFTCSMAGKLMMPGWINIFVFGGTYIYNTLL